MNRTNIHRLIGLLIVVVVIVAIGKAAESTKADKLAKEGYWGKDDTWGDHSALIGKPAPELSLTAGRLAIPPAKDRMGKVMLIDFWATWCGPCKKAVPHNNEILRKYGEKGVLVLGACGGGGDENMYTICEQLKVEYPCGHITDEVARAWGVKWWPHYVIVDRKGIIRAAGLNPEFLEKVLDAVLEEGEGK